LRADGFRKTDFMNLVVGSFPIYVWFCTNYR